jgi:hypothetical protein
MEISNCLKKLDLAIGDINSRDWKGAKYRIRTMDIVV